MTHVSIKNFIDIGDAGAPIGSPPWCKSAHVNLCAMKYRTDSEVRHLKYGLLEFKKDERWRQLADNHGAPFLTWEDYVQYPEPNGLGIPRESVQAILNALNDNTLLGEVLGKQGQYGRGRPKDRGDNVTSKGRGNSRAYILARLDRDGHAELAAKVRADKMSAKAAAAAAGFPRTPPLTPFEQVLKLWPKLTDSERARITALK